MKGPFYFCKWNPPVEAVLVPALPPTEKHPPENERMEPDFFWVSKTGISFSKANHF